MATPNHYHRHQQPICLEQFLQSQEAAKSFDDDLDFCPSLSATELSEKLLESASTARNDVASISSSPGPLRSRAIAIVDPASKAPLQIPGLPTSTVGSPASVAAMPIRHSSMSSVGSAGSAGSYPASDTSLMDLYLDAQDASVLDWPFQQQQLLQMHQLRQLHQSQQPQQYLYDPMFALSGSQPFAPQDMVSVDMFDSLPGMYSPQRLTSRVPIVNPTTGSVLDIRDPSVVAVPEWHFVSVR
ncbi:hypothetical protein EDD21DRAFT_409897 [Dissophora ornata]|nr:hypothetical protein BGZ58_010446 [Dissophora ornata]KAI8606701.1 hypothetical protein EDD21DRAFT_409897 [Dissophora ornata]